MGKKLFIGIVPLLVTFALAIVPTVAQGAVWYNEGSKEAVEEETPANPGELNYAAPYGHPFGKPTVTWGDLSLKGAATIECHNDIGSTATNRTIGGKIVGIDWIWDFSAFRCIGGFSCPAGTYWAVQPHNLPWFTLLIERGSPLKVADEVKNVKVTIGCAIPPEDNVSGTNFVIGPKEKQDPLAPAGPLRKGTGALHPGSFSYDSGSGELEAEGSSESVTGVTEGETKTLGYENQEHVYACVDEPACTKEG